MARLVRTLLALSLSVPFVAAPTGAHAAVISPDVQLAANADHPVAGITPDGVAHVFYHYDGPVPGLFYASDGTGSWVKKRVTFENDVPISLRIDEGGAIHLLYERPADRPYAARYRTNVSGSWQDRTAYGNVAQGFSIAPDRTAHTLHVESGAWYATNAGGSWVQDEDNNLSPNNSAQAAALFVSDVTEAVIGEDSPRQTIVQRRAGDTWEFSQITDQYVFEAGDATLRDEVGGYRFYLNDPYSSSNQIKEGRMTPTGWVEKVIGPGGGFISAEWLDGAHIAYSDVGIMHARQVGSSWIRRRLTSGADTDQSLGVDARGRAVVAYVRHGSDPTTDDDRFVRVLRTDVLPPTVTARVPTFAVGRTVGGTAPVTIRWNVTDAASSVTATALRAREDSGPWKSIELPSPSARLVVTTVRFGHDHEFHARARDAAGNWSPWSRAALLRLKPYQETNTSVQTFGTWTPASSASAWGGATAYTFSGQAQLDFVGQTVAIVAPRGPGRGQIKVSRGFGGYALVDLEAATEQPRRVVYSFSFATSADHWIKLETVGDQRVDLDGFIMMRPPGG
jgi:hypothetical protein